jgi:sensor histidine kinase YesM
MALGTATIALPPPILGVLAWLRRACAGLSWQTVGFVVGLCAVWAAGTTVHEVLAVWHKGEFALWLRYQAFEAFACMVVIASVMGLPIVAVRNLGPQAGRGRLVALIVTIVLVAPLGAVVRLYYLVWADDYPIAPALYPRLLAMFWLRYALQAALLTIVAEFHRRETLSVEAMHGAEIDRLALDREMAEARLQVLQAQIEPHFLFNTLANVRRLYQTDLAAGRGMLDNLMHYLEVALPRMRETRSSVGRELTLIEAYLNVQRIRMGRRLAFEIDVPPALHALALPPMMLLTLVENAIKHGLNPLPEGGAIRVGARRDGGRLRLDVSDNGRGFHATSGGGIGLANIRARLAAMHGDRARLDLIENQPRGVTSRLELPAADAAEPAS